MTPSRILITGINGLIGGVLQKALVEKYDVYGLDESGPFSDRVLSADISDYKQVAQVFETLRPLHVIHLAGNPSPDASSNHVTGGYEGIESYYFLHRQTEPVKISTKDPVRPDSDYGVSKAFGEAVARYYCARWGVEAICLRIWLSHRDLIQLVEKSLQTNVPFGIYNGISNNKGAFYDILNARDELGFVPMDDASARGSH